MIALAKSAAMVGAEVCSSDSYRVLRASTRVEPPWMSIVIPAKDEEAYLATTLRALRRQQQQDDLSLEVVVVLAGGYERLPYGCADADTVVVETPTLGSTIARARNIGAHVSTGVVLFHTDADVEIPHLASVVSHVRRLMRSASVSAVGLRLLPKPSEARRVDDTMHVVGDWVIRTGRLVGVFLGRGECQIVRASTFDAVGGYREDIVVGEDWDLFQRIARAGSDIRYVRHLVVLHSTRRFRRDGYLKVVLQYAREGLSLVILKRSWLAEWTAVR